MVTVTTVLPDSDHLTGPEIDVWLESLAGERDEADLERLRDACALAAQGHGDRRHASGESLIRRAVAVADILAGLSMDCDALIATVLHDLPMEFSQGPDAQQRFGPEVMRLLKGLAKIRQVGTLHTSQAGSDGGRHAENLRRMLLGLAEDVRVVLIALAERLHDLRLARNLPDEVRRPLARETRDIYAPLANRLGVWSIKWELEDLSLRFLEPEDYKRIARLLDERRGERAAFIAEVIGTLKRELKAVGVKAELAGRPKHIFSIWRKMRRKGVDFERIFDVRAVRILVDDVADCYAALGVVHGLWRHIPGEFDDYIATPKANMYQSLHTAVIGPEDKPVEVQIRTHEMHQHSELGVAAHWRYKENRGHDAEFERRILWMRQWLEMKDEEGGGQEFIERFRVESQPMRVYVLTPKSKVLELPQGATPLDFAYAIHTDIGHRCRGARVDGRIMPLTYQLKSGETVEVLTAKQGQPSRDWLNPRRGYLATARARGKVRSWFKQQDHDQHVAAGRASLERELQRLKLDKPDLDDLARRFNLQGAEDLLAALGSGEVTPAQIPGAMGETRRDFERSRRAAARTHGTPPKGEIIVEGVGDLMTHTAQCCKPVPYDPIVGYITRGHGVSVHRSDCSLLARLDQAAREHLVGVSWSGQAAEATYPVDLVVHAHDRQGLLRDLSALFVDEALDVIGVNTLSNKKEGTAIMRFTVEIADVSRLGQVIARLARLPDVTAVSRQL